MGKHTLANVLLNMHDLMHSYPSFYKKEMASLHFALENLQWLLTKELSQHADIYLSSLINISQQTGKFIAKIDKEIFKILPLIDGQNLRNIFQLDENNSGQNKLYACAYKKELRSVLLEIKNLIENLQVDFYTLEKHPARRSEPA